MCKYVLFLQIVSISNLLFFYLFLWFIVFLFRIFLDELSLIIYHVPCIKVYLQKCIK